MISLDTAAVVTWSGRESSATMTLRTLRGEERSTDLDEHDEHVRRCLEEGAEVSQRRDSDEDPGQGLHVRDRGGG